MNSADKRATPRAHVTGAAAGSWDDLPTGLCPIDFHVHAGPDVRPRRCDVVELADAAVVAGFRGVVIKSHGADTSSTAYVLSRLFPSLDVFGGIALNHAVGGINPAAVESSLRTGGRLVWFPTHDAENECQVLGRPASEAVTIWQRPGVLRSEVHEVIELIAGHDAVLCTGHLSTPEVLAVHAAARSVGVLRFVVTHCNHRHVAVDLETQLLLARDGATLERVIPRKEISDASEERLVAEMRAVGVGANLLASDLGQAHNAHPVIGFTHYLHRLMSCGLSLGELETMASTVPGEMLSQSSAAAKGSK